MTQLNLCLGKKNKPRKEKQKKTKTKKKGTGGAEMQVEKAAYLRKLDA